MATKKNKGLIEITPRFSLDESKELGKGCFGSVYQGTDNDTGKTVAIKHLRKPEDFLGEIETLEKLSTLKHPYIMGFYGYEIKKEGGKRDDVYLFIEFCSGGVLTDLIKKGLEEEEVLDLFRQLIEGMCYLNAKEIMHRDLKPDNILLGSNKEIKISDFGLARIEDGLEKTGQMGTPLYAGPEIYTNYTDAYNLNCDVWSAGLILHEMLTGRHPLGHISNLYELKNEWKMFEKGEKRIVYPKNMHPQWEYITNIMLTHNFKKRPTFHDILEILKKLDNNETMRKEIRNAKNGIKVDENSKEAVLESYLDYIEKKSDILIDFTSFLNCDKYRHMNDSLKELITFLSVAWYVVKIKNLIRSLRYKNLKFPNKQGAIEQDEKSILIMDKYRNIFEIKLTKYQSYLKEKIIPKLTDEESKPDELKILKNLESGYRLFVEAREGTYDVEETYEEELNKVLAFHKVKPTEEKLASMTLEENKIYCKILLAGLLNTEFPDEMYKNKGFIQNKTKILETENQPELLNFIYKLKNKIK